MHPRALRAPGIIAAAVAATALAAPAAQAAYPGANGDIAIAPYDYERGYFGIGLIGADGTGFRSFDHGMDAAVKPSFSPDGKRIAFVGDAADDGDREIYVMGADGTDVRPLTDNDDEDYAPTWSPDGTQIAFERTGDIWVMNADGTNQRQITFGDTDEQDPAWGSNGIAFTSDKGDGGDDDIWRMGADGGNQEQVSVSDLNERGADWSPDGARVVYMRDDRGPARGVEAASSELVVQTVGETSAQQLTDDWENDYDPAFSPDGTTVVYRKTTWLPVRTTRGRIPQALYLINADGTNERLLTDDVEAIHPDWGPVVKAAQQDQPAKDEPKPAVQRPVTTTQDQQQSRACLSRRNFTIHLPARYGRIVSAKVLVNGKSVRVRDTKPRKSARVDLRELPKGTFSVRIRFRTASGRVLKSVRRYRTCVPRAKSTGRQ